MSSEISKQEYLKRYLSKDKKQKRRKKTEVNISKVSRLKIVDHNIDLKSINFGDKGDAEDIDDEAPVVAEVIDDRPLEVKVKEQYESSRWKKLDNNESTQLHTDRNLRSINSASDTSARKPNSSKRVRHNSDSDMSPPRKISDKKRHDSDSDMSPPRKKSNKKRNDSGSDLSPPRKRQDNLQRKRHDSYSDISPLRKKSEKKRHDSDSDMSPPRKKSDKKRHDSGSDLSPPRKKSGKKRHDSDSDMSPPRKMKDNSQRKNHKYDTSSSHKSKNLHKKSFDSSSDISPPKKSRISSYSKNSPPISHKSKNPKNQYDSSSNYQKKSGSDSDFSPPRHHGKHKIDQIYSLGRNSSDVGENSRYKSGNNNRERSLNDSDSDLSPSHLESSRKSKKDKSKKPQKTLSGLRAGLQDAETLRIESEQLRKREKNQINMLDDDLSGRNAETIIRDRKTGLRRDIEQEQQIKDEKNKKVEEHQKKYAEWGKGIEQTQNKMDKFAEDVYEMSKPLARYKDDEDLDERLKAVIHDDDPMSAYIKKKRQKNMPDVPTYSGPPAPPNRFGILPGYRWDGVDRSNGFEKKYFEKINSKKAIQEESYLWSVQDM